LGTKGTTAKETTAGLPRK